MAMNKSEAHFASYLTSTGHLWVREPKVLGRVPDFKVDEAVICEVASIEKNHLPGPIGVTDAPKPVRDKIRNKWKQSDAARRARLPFVLVIHRTSGMAFLDTEILAAALYGDLGYQGEFDPRTGGAADFQSSFLDRGVVYPDGNRGLSALAVLEDVNPTQPVLDRALAAVTDPTTPFADRVTKRMEILQQLRKRGDYDAHARATRLRVLYSLESEIPLPNQFFRGPLDQEFGIVGGRFAQLDR